MPSSMCSLEPNTGIKVIDEFISHFGKPIYQITVDKTKNIIILITTTTESPCGATARSLRFLFGKEIKPQNFDLFLTNIMQECRESVAYWFSKVDQAGNAIFNHLKPLIDNLKIQIPSLFEKGTEMDEYLKSKLG